MFKCQKTFIIEIEKAFYEFIWPAGKHHVKKDVLIQPTEDGGLKMPDIEAMIKAIKLTWINRITRTNSKLNAIAHAVTDTQDFKALFMKKFDPATHTAHLPLFYKQICIFWDEIHGTEPQTRNEILNEHLWHNKRILIGEKPVYYPTWSKKSINILYDIIGQNGKLMSREVLQTKYSVRIDVMKYNSIISAIPKKWLHFLKDTPTQIFKKVDELKLKTNKLEKDVSKLKCKDFYWHFVCNKYVKPNCTKKWEELYPALNFEWEHIYMIPTQVARETALQSFQYKLINRFLPCKAALKKWKKEDSDLCVECNVVDSLEHHFVQCENVKLFWTMLLEWWNTIYEVSIKLHVLDIVFGIVNHDRDTMLSTLNFCILFAKYYIYKSKLDNKKVKFGKYKYELKQRILYEKCILAQDDKLAFFDERWNVLLTELKEF